MGFSYLIGFCIQYSGGMIRPKGVDKLSTAFQSRDEQMHNFRPAV